MRPLSDIIEKSAEPGYVALDALADAGYVIVPKKPTRQMISAGEIKRLQGLLAKISSHFANGVDGNYSANWDQDDAAGGYWLPTEDAEAIRLALTGRQ